MPLKNSNVATARSKRRCRRWESDLVRGWRMNPCKDRRQITTDKRDFHPRPAARVAFPDACSYLRNFREHRNDVTITSGDELCEEPPFLWLDLRPLLSPLRKQRARLCLKCFSARRPERLSSICPPPQTRRWTNRA